MDSRVRSTTRERPLARELARAARVLAIRSRREAAGLFAGAYASAFRGGGMEFDESRPYQAGDDVRNIDWNAMARTGEPFVKRFREERSRTVLLALDVSASMDFGTTGRSKALAAAHGAALLATAAGRAGDRVGLVAFDESVRLSIPAARGAAHAWHVVRAAVRSGEGPTAGTSLDSALKGVRQLAERNSIVVLLSDFRAMGLDDVGSPGEESALMTQLASKHDVLSIVLHDPRDEQLPDVGSLRLVEPERADRALLLDSSSERVRNLYHHAWLARRQRLERGLRGAGSDVLWLRTDRDPLRTLMHFFRERAARVRVAPR